MTNQSSSIPLSSSSSTTSPSTTSTKKRTLKPTFSILMSATAACAAVLYSNIFETVKTRLQLDGEGATKGMKPRVYKGLIDATVKIYQTEGWKGLHAGLVSALVYQAIMNGVRLGCYEKVNQYYRSLLNISSSSSSSSSTSISKTPLLDVLLNALSGATSGALGATIGSPIYLVKNRLQAESKVFVAREKYGYTGLIDGLQKIWKVEGIKGLFLTCICTKHLNFG